LTDCRLSHALDKLLYFACCRKEIVLVRLGAEQWRYRARDHAEYGQHNQQLEEREPESSMRSEPSHRARHLNELAFTL
jgi:hypothetical protein